MESRDKNEVRITFYVDGDFHAAFKAQAAVARPSMQAIMLQLVRDWLAGRGALPTPLRKQGLR